MNERKLFEGILIFICCIVAVVLGKVVSRGDLILTIAPFVGIIGVYLGFRYRTLLPAIALGMMWYGGGSPFLDDLPYSFYFICAACGISVMHIAMKIPKEDSLDRELPVSALAGIVALLGVVIIFVAITLLKKKGFLPVSLYGAAGGLTYSVKYLLITAFVYFVFNGRITLEKLDRIPKVALVVAALAAAIDAINYLNPNTAFITYYFTTGINFEVMGVLRGATDSVLRLSGLRELGLYIVLYLCSRIIVRSRKQERFTISYGEFSLFAISGFIILMSGYRGFLIRYAIVLFAFLWVYRRRLAVLGILGGASIWILGILIGSSITQLPLPVQRVLGSLPGVYKTNVAYSALGGIDWRLELYHRFFDNQFWKHPWFGRGQVGDFHVVAESAYADPILFFEVTQLWHSGVASALDMVGIFGACFLLLAQVITLGLSIKMWRIHSKQLDGWMVWCLLYFYASNIGFWYTGFFHKNFPMMALSMMGVFLSYCVLMRNARTTPEQVELLEPCEEEA